MLSHRFSHGPAGALRRSSLVLGSVCLLFGLHLGAGAVASGCGDSTTGQRIALHTKVTAGEEATKAFKNAYDWSITLSKAYLSVGELYYFDGPPVVASYRPRAPRGLGGFLGFRTAHAHPGHYTEGDALGQMLTPTTVDILKDSELPDGDGVTGTYRSARFEFASPPAGDLAADVDGHLVVVEGEAKKGAETRLFRLTADKADILNADGNPYVEGCIFEETEIPADGTVVLTLRPSVWLDQVDFEAVAESPDGKPVEIPAGDTAHKAFGRGLQKGTGFGFSYVEDKGAAK